MGVRETKNWLPKGKEPGADDVPGGVGATVLAVGILVDIAGVAWIEGGEVCGDVVVPLRVGVAVGVPVIGA